MRIRSSEQAHTPCSLFVRNTWVRIRCGDFARIPNQCCLECSGGQVLLPRSVQAASCLHTIGLVCCLVFSGGQALFFFQDIARVSVDHSSWEADGHHYEEKYIYIYICVNIYPEVYMQE